MDASDWLREMLRTTDSEFPEFIVAMSLLFGLDPDDARGQLEVRAEKLVAELADTESQLRDYPRLPRVFLLDEEYRRAVLGAEPSRLQAVTEDLHGRRLTWSEPWLREVFDSLRPTDEDEEDGGWPR